MTPFHFHPRCAVTRVLSLSLSSSYVQNGPRPLMISLLYVSDQTVAWILHAPQPPRNQSTGNSSFCVASATNTAPSISHSRIRYECADPRHGGCLLVVICIDLSLTAYDHSSDLIHPCIASSRLGLTFSVYELLERQGAYMRCISILYRRHV